MTPGIEVMRLQVANYLVDRLGKKCVTAELLQPDELISGMISQVAAEPEMALLLNHFIYSTHGGYSNSNPLLQRGCLQGCAVIMMLATVRQNGHCTLTSMAQDLL